MHYFLIYERHVVHWLQPELYPGKCWAFRGSEGFLVIALSYPVRITHVTLEHLPKVLSPTGRIDSAPRNFAVYVSPLSSPGFSSKNTQSSGHHMIHMPCFSVCCHMSCHQGMSSEHEEGTLLETFTYEQNAQPVQTFKLTVRVESLHALICHLMSVHLLDFTTSKDLCS